MVKVVQIDMLCGVGKLELTFQWHHSDNLFLYEFQIRVVMQRSTPCT